MSVLKRWSGSGWEAVGSPGQAQPLDATLTALAALNATAGLVEQTGADAFTKRAMTGAGNVVTKDTADQTYATTGLALMAAWNNNGIM